VNWVDRKVFEKYSYFGTALERFRHKFRSDMVLMLDADILIARSFADGIERCYREKAIGGVIAHICPFDDFSEWQKHYDALRLGKVHAPYEHTGWGYMFNDVGRRYCPPYFNLGVLMMPSHVASQMGDHIFGVLDVLNKMHDNWYRCQLAVSLTITKLKIPHIALPMRFNFPNDKDLEALHPAEQQVACILHFLREHQGLTKHKIFQSVQGVEEVLAREDLRAINAQVQEVLAGVHATVLHDRR